MDLSSDRGTDSSGILDPPPVRKTGLGGEGLCFSSANQGNVFLRKNDDSIQFHIQLILRENRSKYEIISLKESRHHNGYFLKRRCFLYLPDYELVRNGAPGGDRTHDPLLRRQLLYPLSYQGFSAKTVTYPPFDENTSGKLKFLSIYSSRK